MQSRGIISDPSTPFRSAPLRSDNMKAVLGVRKLGKNRKENPIMNYVGIDIHKRYSVCAAQDEQGRKLGGARIEGNSASAFAQYLGNLEGPCKVAIEACWNWATIYDRLEPVPPVGVVLLGDR